MISKIFAMLMIERPGRKHDYAGWAKEIEASGEELVAKLATSADSEQNRKVLSHMIGIERWAQSRLGVVLGAPFKQEEYDGYRPDRDASWDEMREQFASVRAESVDLAKQLIENNIPITTKVMHNQMGDLTTRGWLRYIFMHGGFEARAIK